MGRARQDVGGNPLGVTLKTLQTYFQKFRRISWFLMVFSFFWDTIIIQATDIYFKRLYNDRSKIRKHIGSLIKPNFHKTEDLYDFSYRTENRPKKRPMGIVANYFRSLYLFLRGTLRLKKYDFVVLIWKQCQPQVHF